MTRSGRFLTVAVFALAVAAVAVPRYRAWRSEARSQESSALPAAAPRVPTVVVEPARIRPLSERLSTTGTLRANEQVNLASEITGQVAALHFREGTAVRRGQVLMEIDAAELEAQKARAAHRVDLARRREARQRQLVEDGLISSQDYDFVRTDLEVLEAELALVEAQLEKTVLRAPFSGVIGLRFVSPGAYITPQTRIASLQDLDPMKVDFSVPERYAERIALGREVEVRVAGLEASFRAEIYAVEPTVDAATRSLAVRARMQNPDGRLRPGSFADVEVIVKDVAAALTVPNVAVVPELGGKKVLVVQEGVVESRQVTTGIRTETHIEITSGLAAGDRVIVRGLQSATPGAPVDIQERPASAAASGPSGT